MKFMKNKYYIYANISKDINKALEDIECYAKRYNMEKTDNPQEAGLIISVGGDGTFLEASKLNVGVPIFGVNKGTLGYLTEIEESRINIAIMDFVNENYENQKRMMLDYYVSNKEKEDKCIALNDIVISKRNSSTIGIDVLIDDILINSYFADGIIVSTPTGSTGYSLSCGGPIIDPKSEMIIITPISPHTMINRSIVVSADSKIVIKVTRTRGDNGANLSIDGTNKFIEEGEEVTIYKAKKYTNLITFDEHNFLEKIRQKMR